MSVCKSFMLSTVCENFSYILYGNIPYIAKLVNVMCCKKDLVNIISILATYKNLYSKNFIIGFSYILHMHI